MTVCIGLATHDVEPLTTSPTLRVRGLCSTGFIALLLLASPPTVLRAAQDREISPSASAPTTTVGAFSGAGTLRHSHPYGTATVLRDGRILVIGGESSRPTVSSAAELFDPATGSSRTLRSPRFPRVGHSATLLADGRVLVMGGWNGLRVAEVYDPTSGRFHRAGRLIQARGDPISLSLPDGRVLVLGGYHPGVARPFAELWDPAMSAFRRAGTLAPGMCDPGAATRLIDARVLVIGTCGDGYSHPGKTTAQVWDAASRSFRTAGSFPVSLGVPTATLLEDGRVLVVGGGTSPEPRYLDDASSLGMALIWDPVTEAFAPTTSLSGRRSGHTATRLPDGRVLIIGGWGRTINDELASALIFDPISETWSPAGDMPRGRAEHDAFLLANGLVLVVGDSKYGGYQRSVLIWTPIEAATR